MLKLCFSSLVCRDGKLDSGMGYAVPYVGLDWAMLRAIMGWADSLSVTVEETQLYGLDYAAPHSGLCCALCRIGLGYAAWYVGLNGLPLVQRGRN